MNIYLHVELSFRELDSKLLLAILAAENGHQVIISNMSEIMQGIRLGVFPPGIFHTKSLTPSKSKITRHQNIIDRKFLVTSIDEEAGVDRFSYNQFAKDRYSDKTIEQSSAAFCWGDQDTETLKKTYPKNSEKFFKTGSPRVDLWKSSLSDYWISPKGMPEKPFLLVSSNMNSTRVLNFHDNIKFHNDAGYFERDPNLYKNLFYMMAENYKKLYSFIEAIKYLAENNNRFEIVLRPHPTEDVKAWEIFLENVPNVHVIRLDSITSWVKNSFAVMHNGCTTAIEATVSGKPVLTYKPFEMEYANELPNTLGYNIKSKEELLIKANELLNSKENNIEIETEIKDHKTISQKLYIDINELAARKILRVWESFDDEKYSQPINWLRFNWLKITNLRNHTRKILAAVFPNNSKNVNDNFKFPPLDENDIRSRLSRLQNILGLKKKIECKLISDRTIFIKKS